MGAASISKTELVLEAAGGKIRCELKRHLSPRTAGLVLRALPLEGNAHRFDGAITYIETPVKSGIERARKEFKAGDIAFLPAGGCICFFADDAEPGKVMTPIGRMLDDPSILKKLGPGDTLRFYQAS